VSIIKPYQGTRWSFKSTTTLRSPFPPSRLPLPLFGSDSASLTISIAELNDLMATWNSYDTKEDLEGSRQPLLPKSPCSPSPKRRALINQFKEPSKRAVVLMLFLSALTFSSTIWMWTAASGAPSDLSDGLPSFHLPSSITHRVSSSLENLFWKTWGDSDVKKLYLSQLGPYGPRYVVKSFGKYPPIDASEPRGCTVRQVNVVSVISYLSGWITEILTVISTLVTVDDSCLSGSSSATVLDIQLGVRGLGYACR
jgi:hypothetical protein